MSNEEALVVLGVAMLAGVAQGVLGVVIVLVSAWVALRGDGTNG